MKNKSEHRYFRDYDRLPSEYFQVSCSSSTLFQCSMMKCVRNTKIPPAPICLKIRPSQGEGRLLDCWLTAHTVYRDSIGSVCRTVLVYILHNVQGVYRDSIGSVCRTVLVYILHSVQGMYRECIGSVCWTVLAYNPRSVQGVSVGLCRCTALTMYKECLSDSVGLQPTQCTGSVCRTVTYSPHSVQGVYRECLSDCVDVQPIQCTRSV